MSALDEVARHVEGRTDLAGVIVDALDVAGYLVDPSRGLTVIVDTRQATDVLECQGVRTFWNGGRLLGVTFPVGWRAVTA